MNDPLPSSKKASGNGMKQFALATELPLLVAGGALVGGLIGYFLDRSMHTKPYLMILLGALGFFAAVRDMLRRLQKDDPDGPPAE